jgi:putative phosphoribosyl transferase
LTFRDRTDAGIQLGEQLAKLDLPDPVVVGMARGGIPVGFEIAKAFEAPLDVIVVRKLGHPAQPELGLGALAEGGVRVINTDLVSQLQVPQSLIDQVAAREQIELDRRVSAYLGDRPAVAVNGRTVIVVDDGLATGFTALAAVEAMRKRGARRVVLAVPVAPPSAVATLRAVADEVACLDVTERFFGISEWYSDFRQVSDDEVVELLEKAHEAASRRSRSSSMDASVSEVRISAGGHLLPGDLAVPPDATGLVLFAHGSGSSRLSPRNKSVARVLQEAGLATLLFDLLTEDEASERNNVFDISMLASRIVEATTWARESWSHEKAVGYFGASTGAAGALLAAVRQGPRISAVVSRGGRPDLAEGVLPLVTAPTLLIVGGRDPVVREMNEQALAELRCERRLDVVAGATHLFEEPGTLEQVAELAAGWFAGHLRR